MARFGAFGKMPALGDFLRMDLPQGFVGPWDKWLQQALLSAREALGERWQGCYFSAPIWRFGLSAGVAGSAPMLGVMMSSVDRVGRSFPLTLGVPLPEAADTVLTHLLAGTTFEALEQIALLALEDDMTKEALRESLVGLSCPAGTSAATLWPEGGGALLLKGASPDRLAPELAAALVGGVAGGGARQPTIWSAQDETGLRMMLCDGLPEGARLQGLFDMEAPLWQEKGGA